MLRLPILLAWFGGAALLLGAASALPAPVVVVYPLAVNGDADKEAGSRLAVLFATQLAEGGTLTVKPPPPGLARADYLAAARSLDADYYVTGYVTPLGNEVSLVEQVVSTTSGIVVWSNTVQIQTYREATGQSDLMRAAILRHAGRNLAAYDTPIVHASATPTPEAGKQEANLGKIFSRKPKARAAEPAPPKAATVAAPPVATRAPRSVLTSAPIAVVSRAVPTGSAESVVVDVSGDLSSERRAYASRAIVTALNRLGKRTALAADYGANDVPARAKDVCASHNAAQIFSGVLSLERVGTNFAHGTTADFELIAYDCSGKVTFRDHAQTQASGRHDWSLAIDRAVSSAVGTYATPPRRRS